jgi:small neutral amino acid transporter SnatA (MarC family)
MKVIHASSILKDLSPHFSPSALPWTAGPG